MPTGFCRTPTQRGPFVPTVLSFVGIGGPHLRRGRRLQAFGGRPNTDAFGVEKEKEDEKKWRWKWRRDRDE